MSQETDVTVKKSRTRRRQALIPVKFRPRFWADSDQRVATVKLIRKRYQLLREHAGGGESYQRDLLCQRAAFISIILETQEVEAVEKGTLDLGGFVQAVNSLQGLLKSLGLEKRIKQVGDLSTYLETTTRNGRQTKR